MVRIYLSKNKKYPGGRLNKTKKKPKPKNQFDIIGTFLTEKSMTGENLTRQIFSYLDISSLFRVQMVSKTWRQNLDYGNIGFEVLSLGYKTRYLDFWLKVNRFKGMLAFFKME